MNWRGKLSHPRQLGGIETAVLDNGPGRGCRIAWVNTGSPLRYKIVIDRGLDILDAFWGEHALAWLSRASTAAPHPAAGVGLEWLRSFNGGLMTTCGLSHVGPPETDDAGTRGLHGNASNTPAELTRIEQPDPERGQTTMALSGTVRETPIFGPQLVLQRTIRSELGQPELCVEDSITNCGNEPAPHMLLYHCNLGYPLVDEGAKLVWKGATRSRGLVGDDRIFAGGHDYRTCPAPMAEHAGSGEACGFIVPEADDDGLARASVFNPALHLSLEIAFDPTRLPCLTNWQHWGVGEYVTGLEPGTHHPVGQNTARRDGTLIMLEPGETRDYKLSIRVVS